MMAAMISAADHVENLTKRYGQFTAVDDVSFVAQPGKVTGFLGPNGAGKSTSMRIMVGLTPPDGGQAPSAATATPRSRTPPVTSACCSTPRPSTPAAPAARCCASAPTRWAGRTRVEEMLALVGLSGTEAKRRVRNYSLGMRQRLGIANALLGDPSVLILDEPVNGLDPAGIHWMRGLLRNFAGQGGTVLLSSHLLHEVEMIADEMVLIGRGKIVAQGTKAELLQTRRHLRAAAEDPAARRAALAAASIDALPSGDGGFRAEADPVEIGARGRCAASY